MFSRTNIVIFDYLSWQSGGNPMGEKLLLNDEAETARSPVTMYLCVYCCVFHDFHL